MQSFALLQHCALSVAFQSTHQILLWHFQRFLLLQARLLPFLVPTIFQSLSLSLNPVTFPLSPFLFPLLLHQLVQQYRWLSPSAPSWQLKLCLVFLPLSRCHTESWYPTTFTSSFFTAPSGMCSYQFSVCSNPFFLQRSQWTFFATLSCRLLYSLWDNVSHPLTKYCTLSPFLHIICTSNFHLSYQCGAWRSLAWWPVPVQHITALLFRSLNLFWITIVRFYTF